MNVVLLVDEEEAGWKNLATNDDWEMLYLPFPLFSSQIYPFATIMQHTSIITLTTITTISLTMTNGDDRSFRGAAAWPAHYSTGR